MSYELIAENMKRNITPLFTFKSRGKIFKDLLNLIIEETKDLSRDELMQANQSGHIPTGIMHFILATKVKI